MGSSLRMRMTLASGGALALALACAGIVMFSLIERGLHAQVEQDLRSQAAQMLSRAGVAAGPLGEGPGGPGGGPGGPRGPGGVDGPGMQRGSDGELFDRDDRRRPFGGAPGVAQVLDEAGEVQASDLSGERLPVTRADRRIAAAGDGEHVATPVVDGVHVMVFTRGFGDGGALQIARPLGEADDTLAAVAWILLVASLGAIGLASLTVWLLARRALRPVLEFTDEAERIAATTDASQRMPEEGTDELRGLASAINATLDALSSSIESQRHLIADASHELRTPLASLRANVQVLEDAHRLPPEEQVSLRADIVAELDELTALVGDVLDLARGARPPAVQEDVRLDEIVETAAGHVRRRSGGEVEVLLHLAPTVVVGDGTRIARAVSNVLDNARKWSPPGSGVEVELTDGVVRVRDHGPGFAEADVAHVFDRFWRSDEARAMPGSGLGLAIVRQAAESHGGAATAANAEGGGAVVSVSFGPWSAPETP